MVGGFDASTQALATVEVYNPATNSWRTLSPTPTAGASLAGGAVNGVLYAMGGLNGAALATTQACTP